MGEIRNAYKIFIRKTEENRERVRPRRRWQNNIRVDLMEKWWERVEWIHLAQNRDQWWDAHPRS
jgi:hypothetical protein